MKDGLARRSVKRVALKIYDFRLRVHRAASFRAGNIRYELGGACQRSGQCCEAPGIQVSKTVFYLPFVRRLFLLWHEHVNGFVKQDLDRDNRVFYFRCMHYERDARRCDSYDSRPGMCRDYPLLLTEQANPQPFERCGYKLLSIQRDRMLRALEEQELSAEQMEKLKKGLNLE